MKILILTLGTRGDVQPYIALGSGLQAAGHTVTIATSPGFNTLVTDYGLGHAPLSIDAMALLETPEGRAALGGKGLVTLIRRMRPFMRRMLDEGWQAAQGADAIIYNPKALSGYHVAEKLGIPAFVAHPVPILAATRAFAMPSLPVSNLGGMLNKLSYALIKAAQAPFQGMINEWRKEALGLPPIRNERVLNGKPIPLLYPFSPQVIPVPSDWDDSVVVTGYWFLDHPAGWQPPVDLVQFLREGPPPVYVGFGSMAGQDPATATAAVLGALRETGVRAVVATGNGGLSVDSVPDNVLLLKEAPHDWLFPRMAAIVHHGGAGTTAAACRAGRPQLICPYFADQPFWGKRVAALGVGPRPIKQKKLSVERLAQAITTLTTDGAMQTRAAELGVKIRAETGVARAVEAINARLSYASSVTAHAPLTQVA